LGTKIDIKDSKTKEDLEKIFDFTSIHNSHPFNFNLTSLKDDDKYIDSFKWISEFI
jgi:hypothetical protein